MRFWLALLLPFLCAAALADPAPVELIAGDGAIRPASADWRIWSSAR
ncbi:MAG TPA: hypothetical protein VNU64_08340 [Burkholderiales bacterium]|nr:hypothetical protein [Burkholderiales bacterium]